MAGWMWCSHVYMFVHNFRTSIWHQNVRKPCLAQLCSAPVSTVSNPGFAHLVTTSSCTDCRKGMVPKSMHAALT